ncbi:tetratricopeptide repeat protein [Luteimonas sp. BDR2-5]|uniref:YfgM family protein n=1 Tax=Proluteimonas luteida TaxID=2878685 RepID=UPI001E5BD4EF|nr:tetratricopeptide repeat protein [Luteimonas sp. BDR2-5]MCD9026987.1 tetratricopeptide repeat protein [Luteimonas sp. BDR2-5]
MAIDELLDEREQGERVKAWLRENSLGLVAGAAIGGALIFGWSWWKNHTYNQRVAEHATYQGVLASIAAGDLDKAAGQVDALPDTAYGELLALQLAKAQLDADDRDGAIATLQAARDSDIGISAVVQQRLARLLTDAGRGEDAVTLLAGADNAVALEARGDAHFALEHTDQARDDYAEALRRLDSAAPQRGLLELKLSEVGGTPDASEVES